MSLYRTSENLIDSVNDEEEAEQSDTALDKSSNVDFTEVKLQSGDFKEETNRVKELYSQFNKMKGRREIGTYSSENRFINHVKDHVSEKLIVTEYEMQLGEPDLNGAPRIRGVWLNQLQNMELHKTNAYSSTDSYNTSTQKQLVIRRGFPFYLDVSFDQPFDVKRHSLTIMLQFGKSSTCNSASMICIRFNDGLKPNTWSAGIPKRFFLTHRLARKQEEEEEDEDYGRDDEEKKKEVATANLLNANKMSIQINSPATAAIGKFSLSFDTALLPKSQWVHSVYSRDTKQVKKEEDDADKVHIMRTFHSESIFMLCNPWKKEDQTYMENEVDLKEFVENEIGWIYMGTHNQLKVIQWVYDQHHNTVLNAALYIFEQVSLSVEVRNDVSLLVRAICQYVNSYDNMGLLEGNWSGDYGQSSNPTHWIGSLAILQEFMQTKKPVKYTHCYVSAAVAVSLCRSLGIPSRCVTNYLSAHDNDGYTKVKVHWGIHGQPIDVLNTPTFWTFHVWCEAFMKRPKLPLNSYNGWQAFDPTPQESSFGVVCAGPCPVEAIKQGDFNSFYDTRLIFSELQAHNYHWIMQPNGNWRVISQPKRAGNRILTHDPSPKNVKNIDECSPAIEEMRLEALNIKENYKYREGIVLERVALERADTDSINWDVFDLGDGDINFFLCPGDFKAGKIISVALVMQNTGTEERTIDITLSLYTSYYTGISKYKIKTETSTVLLKSLQKQKVTLRATIEEYCWYTTDFCNFKAYAIAKVHLTNQVFCTVEDFCLEVPEIDFELQKSLVLVDEETEIKLTWMNPLPIGLGSCMWTVQGPGLIPYTVFPHDDLEPLSAATLEIKVIPTEVKMMTLLASFSCDRSFFVKGKLNLNVKELTDNLKKEMSLYM